MTLTIGSLFSGIGGLELGLERGIGNGAHTVWQVEQNAYCRAVLAKHWPDATRYEDVRDVGRANLPAVDVLCGGFPCQDISIAGRKAGIDGARSGLWSEYVRIIREMGPEYVVVENVARLLADGMGRVLGDLAALGYDAEWDCLPASALGAPHQRDRLFLLAYPQRERSAVGATSSHRGQAWDRVRHDVGVDTSRAGRWVLIEPRSRRLDAADARRSRGSRLESACCPGAAGPWGMCRAEVVQRVTADPFAAGPGWPQPLLRRVDDGLSHRVDRLHALGNAVVPQVAEVVGRLIAEREARQAVAA